MKRSRGKLGGIKIFFIFKFQKGILFMVRHEASYGSSITITCIFLQL